jgi:hypothetical protein
MAFTNAEFSGLSSMAALFETGRIIDLVLLLVAVEAVALRVWRGRAARPLLVGLLPGVALMLAVRAALADAAWPWVATALVAALALHLLDLRGRIAPR